MAMVTAQECGTVWGKPIPRLTRLTPGGSPNAGRLAPFR